MRGNKLRITSGMLLAALCAGLVTWCERFIAAQPVPAGPAVAGKDGDKDKEKDKDLRPPSDAELPFGFPYERDARNQLKAARDYLTFKEIPWNTVCPLLQNILDAKSDSFFNIDDKAGANVLIRRISVKTEANRIIAAFPKEGLEFYQQTYGQSATTLLDDAVKNNYDLTMLADLSQRYFHTRAGAEGTVLLGTIYLERGNYLEAAYAFERLLARPSSDEFLTPRTLFKAALALKRSGDPRHAAPYQTTLDRLQKAVARNGLVIGRKTFTGEQLRAELDRSVESVRRSISAGEWNTHYGNPQRNEAVDGGPPFLSPAYLPTPMLFTGKNEVNSWLEEELSRLFDRENKNIKSLPLPGFFPITTPDLVIFRSYDSVYAIATRDHTVVFDGKPTLFRAGERRWSSPAAFGVSQLMTTGNANYSDTNIKNDVTAWWATYKSTDVSSILYENPLLGSLSHDGVNVYFIDDVAIPPPPTNAQNPQFAGMGGVAPYRQSGELADAIRAGQLAAVDITTGNRVWELGRVETKYIKGPVLPRLTEEEADKTTNAFQLCLDAIFLGPPLPLNGRLYVLIEQAGVVRLLCLDPKNLVEVKDWPQKVPSLVWTQKLGKPNSILPGDSIRRFQGAFLAAGEGILACPTNSGAVVGVDIMSRSLLWAHPYRKLEPPKPVTYDPNTGRPQPTQQLPNDRWRAAAPIVSGGRVVLAAYDSNRLECLDIRSGKLLWTVPREATDLYVGGVVNDKVIVVGKSEVRAIHLTGENAETLEPKAAWRTPLPSAVPTGHGMAGKSVYYLPVRQENAGKDTTPAAEIWALNVDTGAVSSKTAARKRDDETGAALARYGLGNLVYQNGLVIAQSAIEVGVYPQLEMKKAEMDRKLKANPKDPEGLTDRGELLLDDGKLKEAIADFKEAEKNHPSDHLKQRVRDKLYVAYTELLRENFAAGESFLGEYKALCEVSLDTDDPLERKRREDETLRRKRLHLYLVAKGREGQGRLGEAFDHYLALSSLGEGKSLFEMPDEPNVRMRPDVWARGRIEGMIRKTTDPAARKSLESRVNKEWETVKAGNDLNRLREFVSVFGPYFSVGATAELKLADLLLQTNNDEDTRDAQIHLSQLRVTAEDPAIRAKATESLARLMIKNGLLEDAVGLYLQLGKDYPEIAIRDGKTGSDFLTDLLTDKRLLPYLEPARYPLPTRVKAEQRDATGEANRGAAFEVEPDGELFPMFRRLRFVMDTQSSGNGTWTLRAYDRGSGVERCRFGNLQPQIGNLGTMSSAKFLQASGHLLLVHLGPWVYCLDLAEKRELWHKNLLGDGVAVNQMQIADNRADGDEMVVRFTDGTSITIGKSVVVQPNYACLLTRDGLEVVEPTTRRQLWSRRHLQDRTHVYGDARYIVLVECGADRRPQATKLLRAVDGMTVEGAPNAGRILAAARSYHVYGHTVLLVEGAGDQPRVLRLYDLSSGKDVWRKEYDAKAVPIRSLNPDWTGVVKSTGEVEVLAVRTGQSLGAFQIDKNQVESHVNGCAEAKLLADAERFYLVLDRDGKARGAGRRFPIYNFSLRTHAVNGPMYCFDRTTGKRLWYLDDVLDNQSIVLERFADLPVIVAAAPMMDKNNTNIYKVVVIEKERGMLRFNRAVPYTGNFFQVMTVDVKNGAIDLHRHDLRIHIFPEDEKQAAK